MPHLVSSVRGGGLASTSCIWRSSGGRSRSSPCSRCALLPWSRRCRRLTRPGGRLCCWGGAASRFATHVVHVVGEPREPELDRLDALRLRPGCVGHRGGLSVRDRGFGETSSFDRVGPIDLFGPQSPDAKRPLLPPIVRDSGSTNVPMSGCGVKRAWSGIQAREGHIFFCTWRRARSGDQSPTPARLSTLVSS